MANVFKRGGKWYLRFRESRRDRREVLVGVKTKREAELEMAKRVQELSNGSYQQAQRQAEVTFSEVCADFLSYSKAHKRSWKRDILSIRFLTDYFGNCNVKEITPTRIEDYILQRRSTVSRFGRPLKPASINLELAALKTILNRAVRNGKLQSSPMQHIKLLKSNNVRDRVLSKEEFERLLEASPDHLKPILIMAHETGMRSGEIFGLTWNQVDLDRRIITLRAEQTKTNEGRKIPISPLLHQTLHRMWVRKRTGSVFNYLGIPQIKSVKNCFRTTCRKAGIEGFRFHDFRHTFVTNMRRAGKQDRVIMAITGHKTMSMLMRYDTVGEDEILRAVGVDFEKVGTKLAQEAKMGSGESHLTP